ncbi:hypothetical protein [Microtetraspora niveoalba]|uniref:hypothetical protein n=1 Tax=Microtetraspora niveoalba TaxID=46175 RepID=UPI00082AB583|nr:hypothetical protein [Microtetraspora niveoalba]
MVVSRTPPSPPGTPSTVRVRLRTLALLEAGNIPFQAWIWFGLVGLPTTAPNLVGFALVAALLVQGALYWAAKLRQLRERGALPGVRAFQIARATDVPVLVAGLTFTGCAVAADPGRGSWPGLLFALFAVLEYVNYFHVQLMHDTAADLRRLLTTGPRRSHLARDLARRRRR